MNKIVFLLVCIVISNFAYAVKPVDNNSNGFASGGYSNNVIVNNGVMYLAGDNSYGKLVKDGSDRYTTFIKFTSNVKDVAGGYDRTAYIASNDQLYYIGWRTSSTDVVAPTLISNNVTDVSMTGVYVYYISNKTVYEFNPQANTTKVLGMNSNSEPVRLATGTSHLVVLTSGGTVLTYGANNVGQLCSGDNIAKTSLTSVSNNVKFVAANGNNTYLVMNTGEVKACGSNTSGQIGLGKTTPASINTPTLIPNATGVNKVAATTSGLYILRNDGMVDLVGWHNYIGPNNKPYNSSSKIVNLAAVYQITDIGAGSDSIYLKDKYGVITAWGGNLYGKLGDGSSVEKHGPVVITLPENEREKHCTMEGIPCNNDKNYK